MDQVGFYLGVALTSYLHIFRPDVIVLAGGVAQGGSLLIEPIRKAMNRLASPWYLEHFHGIELSSLGTEGQAIGAASFDIIARLTALCQLMNALSNHLE